MPRRLVERRVVVGAQRGLSTLTERAVPLKLIAFDDADDFSRMAEITPEEFTAICNSLKATGQTEPPIVRTTSGGYKTVSGFVAVKAAKKLGLETLSCRTTECSDEQAAAFHWIDAITNGKGLKTYEYVQAIGRMYALGMATTEIVNVTNRGKVFCESMGRWYLRVAKEILLQLRTNNTLAVRNLIEKFSRLPGSKYPTFETLELQRRSFFSPKPPSPPSRRKPKNKPWIQRAMNGNGIFRLSQVVMTAEFTHVWNGVRMVPITPEWRMALSNILLWVARPATTGNPLMNGGAKGLIL